MLFYASVSSPTGDRVAQLPSFAHDIPKIINDNKNSGDRVAQLSNWGLRPRSPEGNSVKNLEVKSIRKNTAKLLQRDDTSNSTEGRSVVNIALENYSKRVKMKTLNESSKKNITK